MRLAFLAVVIGLVFPGGSGLADDTDLFSTAVAPNVLLVIDNSGSMNHLVWHEAYDASLTPTCDYYDNGLSYGYTSDSTLTHCGKSIVLYHDPETLPNNTRITGRYLNWLFSPESTPYQGEIEGANNGSYSTCVGGGSFHRYRRSRITAAKDILRDVICQVNAAGAVRFGLAQFRVAGDPNGGYVRVPIDDYTAAHASALDAAIDVVDANTWTPLGETLFQAYTYFMSRDAGDRPFGADGSTRFPEYVYTTSDSNEGGPYSASGAPTVPDSPVQFWCQKNFVVIITDGEPARDDFDVSTPTNQAQGFGDFDDLIGDYNPDGEGEEPGGFPGCSGCETALYLDDIAMFMQKNDFRPDVPGDQVIDTYTVGFTTSAFANAVLEKTAQVGNGLFFYSNDAEELSAAIVSAITDIIKKSQSFTAATVPAARTSADGNLFTSSFVPANVPYWEGHLESYRITAAGEIHDANGVCALDDATPGECFDGPFLSSAVPFWDAGEEVPAPGSRSLYTTLPGVSGRVGFDNGLSAANLGVVFPPGAAYPGSTALNAEGLTDEIVQNVRGCELGTGAPDDVSNPRACLARPWRLGDIFHSSPVLVGSPASFLPDLSYKGFEGLYGRTAPGGPRPRVLYAGANDGFLRGFLAGSWDTTASPPAYDRGTGEELFGFMPWPARQKIRQLPLDTGNRDQYFVDGSPSVADVWLYSNPRVNTKVCNNAIDCEWHTLLVSGLREGGAAYHALDISDPTAAGYPGVLWEFPREDDASGVQDFVGETWSEPILTKIRVQVGVDDNGGAGFERWVAIFAGGYHPNGDPNDHAAYDPNASEGRAIFVVDLTSGRVIAEKRLDLSAFPGDPVGDMRFALAATPAVFDLDFDGFADVIYVGDLGGNVWKWVIGAIGEDRVNDATGLTSQPAWPFRKFFQAPSYDDGSNVFYKSFFFAPAATLKNHKLWLAFGSGERANLRFLGDTTTPADNNRFYAVRDIDPHEASAVPEATLSELDLLDVTADQSCADVTAYRGYFFITEEGEKFVTDVDLFVHQVLAATFTPSTTVEPCEASGNAALYVFKIDCGQGFFDDGLGNDVRKVDLGAGIPSTPRISIGTQGDSSNRVIITTTGTGSSGSNIEIENLQAPPGFDSGLRQFYWRELTQ